jgi:integral membrane protein
MTAETIEGPLARYRVMAVVTGSVLVIVFLGLLRYIPGLESPEWIESAFGVIAQIHGVIYIIYLIACYLLWSKTTWKMTRLFLMALGGIVPLLSFYSERRIAREVAASLSP